MKFVISTQELNYLINKIQNVVPLKPTIPILSNFLIEAANDELILTATDLTVSIRCSTEVNILEEGATTLPAKRFAQLVRELTTTNIEIKTDTNDITTIISGTSRFKLKGMNKDTFPDLPDLSVAHPLHINEKKLKEVFYQTSFAVSKEDNRYVLTGILMQIENGEITFVGTDGKRLARTKIATTIPSDFTSQSIIPIKAVDEIVKNLTNEEEVQISLMTDKIAIQINQTLLIAKLLSGDYPDVRRVIPENLEIIISLHREELMTLLRQVSLFTADQHHSARFIFMSGELSLTANTSDIGEGQVSMPINYQGNKLEIAFNPGFMNDILRHCKEETVTISLMDAYNPAIIVDGECAGKLTEASPLFVLMPMRLAEE